MNTDAERAPNPRPTAENIAETIAAQKSRLLLAAAADGDLPAVAVRVLIAALDHVHRTPGPWLGLLWPSLATLAIGAASNQRSTHRALAQLAERGYLVRVSGGGGRDKNGNGRTNVFRIGTRPEAATMSEVATVPEAATMPEAATLSLSAVNVATLGTRTVPEVANNPLDIPSRRPVRRNTLAEPEGFADFWSAYPRRVAKGQARKAYAAALGKVSAGTILDGARRYAAECTKVGTEARYIKHPATWLNGECWSDDPAPRGGAPSGEGGGGRTGLWDAARRRAAGAG